MNRTGKTKLSPCHRRPWTNVRHYLWPLRTRHRVRPIHVDHPFVQAPSCLDGFSPRTFLDPCILRPVRISRPRRSIGQSWLVHGVLLPLGVRTDTFLGSKSHVNINEKYMKQIERSPAGIKASDVLSGRYVSPTGSVNRPARTAQDESSLPYTGVHGPLGLEFPINRQKHQNPNGELSHSVKMFKLPTCSIQRKFHND